MSARKTGLYLQPMRVPNSPPLFSVSLTHPHIRIVRPEVLLSIGLLMMGVETALA
jgi:hypothetical protein